MNHFGTVDDDKSNDLTVRRCCVVLREQLHHEEVWDEENWKLGQCRPSMVKYLVVMRGANGAGYKNKVRLSRLVFFFCSRVPGFRLPNVSDLAMMHVDTCDVRFPFSLGASVLTSFSLSLSLTRAVAASPLFTTTTNDVGRGIIGCGDEWMMDGMVGGCRMEPLRLCGRHVRTKWNV